jgi:DNA-binding NarL/FixJ family response regulator
VRQTDPHLPGRQTASGERRLRLVVAVGARLYREGLTVALDRIDDLEVVASIGDLTGAQAACAAHRPDVLLVDAGLSACPAASRALIASQPQLRIVALGLDDEDPRVIAFAEAGICAFVAPGSGLTELALAVRDVAHGEARCSGRLAALLLRRISELAAGPPVEAALPVARLTRRERQILELIDAGLSNKEIASRLGIGVATVKNHVHNVIEKLGGRNRPHAAALARASTQAAAAARR